MRRPTGRPQVPAGHRRRSPAAAAWLLVCLIVAPSTGLAQTKVRDLGEVSIEDLLNIDVTAASRKAQRAGDVAAAVFVITRDDIRHSGMTTIPDLLRLAPGVDVAQVNSNKSAVSVRGFNGLFANKLLVLVDGRTVYTRLFSGVLWDALDLMVDDIDRIEVIRGPGAALWGANAVNGVINIITKTAAETPGGFVRVDAGRPGQQATVRFGGALGTIHYRLFAQGAAKGETRMNGDPAEDASTRATTGFRADWTARPGTFMLEGALSTGRAHALWSNLDPATAASEPIVPDASHTAGGYLLGRWTGQRAGGAAMQVQSFVDVSSRQEPIGQYDRRAFDIDAQYHTALGAHHDLVTGAGYRFSEETLAGGAGVSLSKADNAEARVTAFAQDEISLAGNRVLVTVGTQVQHSAAVGTGVQPTARVMWKVRPQQRIWAATSRALRTPSLTDRGIRLTFPPVATGGLPLVVSLAGNPDAETEHFVDVEVGYRVELGTRASLDVTGFAGRYDHLRTQEPSIAVVQSAPAPRIVVASQFGSELAASTRGFEVSGQWTPLRHWRLDGSYTAFRVTPDLGSASRDPNAASEDGSAPRAQWQLRSTVYPHARAWLNVALFHVGRLDALGIAPYTRVDVNAEWRVSDRVALMISGHNLLDAAHAEFGDADALVLGTEVPRSAGVRVRWSF